MSVRNLVSPSRDRKESVGAPAFPFFVALFCAPLLIAQPTVETVSVVSKAPTRKVRLPGEFAPYLRVDLHARVNGFIEKVNVDRGSIVKEGDVLVVLSAPELVSQRSEAEAKAQAAESQRVEAQAKLIAAESTFDRLKTAAATPGAVANNEIILAGKTVDAARALVAAQEGSLKAARASVASLRELESYLQVRAPFSGVITDRFVHPGALVGPGAGSAIPLLRLEQNSRLRLVVAVPESEVGGIVRGASVPFTVPAYPGENFIGTVARISHAVDTTTRTMPVELDVRNGNGRLAPGMYPEVLWPVRRARPVLLVPPSAVVTTTERTFVIRVRGGRAEYVDVQRGAPIGDLVEIFGALAPGDEVVRRATDELREGAAVRAEMKQK